MVASRVRVARRYLVSGRVQGVGYRYFAQAAAEREAVAGWVRNLPDGRVEAVAEGEPEAVDRFAALLRNGPRNAQVTQVDVVEVVEGTAVTPAADRSGFSIR
jgi:acylphosphatase